MAKYAINGFGRIGRNVLRAMSKEERNKVVAINDLTPIETIAHLLKYDSTQGKFDGEISIEGDYLVVDGHKILITVERDPANLPWKDLGVDVVLESTGLFTKRDAAKKHLDAGAKKVLISAPSPDPDLTFVLGINDTPTRTTSAFWTFRSRIPAVPAPPRSTSFRRPPAPPRPLVK